MRKNGISGGALVKPAVAIGRERPVREADALPRYRRRGDDAEAGASRKSQEPSKSWQAVGERRILKVMLRDAKVQAKLKLYLAGLLTGVALALWTGGHPMESSFFHNQDLQMFWRLYSLSKFRIFA